MLRIGLGLRISSFKAPSAMQAFLSSFRSYTSITEITHYLYENGINFAHCEDASSLRRLYNEVRENDFRQKTKLEKFSDAASSETEVILDPHPGMARHGIEPYQLVSEVKAHLCRKQRLDRNLMDLFLGGQKLDENKRICEYTKTQSFELTLRSKD